MTPAQRKLIAGPAAKALHEDLLDTQVLRGCFNCDWMNKKTSICGKFKTQPPVKVITFSCGKEWVGEIPF